MQRSGYILAITLTSASEIDIGGIYVITGRRCSVFLMLGWLASTNQGNMVGDYISTSIVGTGVAYPVFEVAKAPKGSVLNEAAFTIAGGLPVVAGTNSSSAVVVDQGHAPVIFRPTAV